jgi:hypothetical protein
MSLEGAVTKRWETARDLFGDAPPTEDDVPIARDGRRLDTPEKVRAFLEEISSEVEGGS